MGGVLTASRVLLRPWPALVLGLLLISLAQWWQAKAPLAQLGWMLVGDGLMLLRALPLWWLLCLPLLALRARARTLALGLLASLLLLAVTALNLYFAVSGVPLGADLLAYSWQEMRTTVSGAQLQWPLPMVLALTLALALLWASLLQPRWRGQATDAQARPVLLPALLGACVLGSAVLPTLPPLTGPAASLSANKLGFFVGDVLSRQRESLSATVVSGHPFEHAETTPDTLGPLLQLDAQRPPNLVVIVVEGLGRSFSGPGAPLGSFTPFLDELAGRSLYWENFVATQGRTFAVLPSVLGSLPFGPYGQKPIAHDNLPSLLKAQGYRLRYFSGSSLEFDHQGPFLAASGFDSLWSEKNFAPPAQKASEWGYPDADLIDAVLAQKLPEAPTLTLVQTMSMHTPFAFAGLERYQRLVIERLKVLGIAAAQHPDYLRHQNIYASILYTDDALRRFFTRVAEQPAWRNTVFVVTGDHRLPEIEMASRLERYHVPLIVYSPMLHAPMRIKALSSHFDVAPSLVAMLSHRYGWATPQRVHWMGQGLDVQPQWRNLHSLPLKQTKTELSDYVSGEYYLAQDRLMSLQDGLVTAPEENSGVLQAMRQELALLRAGMDRMVQQGALVAEPGRQQRVPYADQGRTLEPAHRARRIEGVVVHDLQGRFDADNQIVVQGVFSQQGASESPVFVPLLVLSDAQGHELAEASGPATRLQAGQMQALRWASRGTRASSWALKSTPRHQHGGWGWPVVRCASIAQPLGPPHSGQRVGSTGGVASVMAGLRPWPCA